MTETADKLYTTTEVAELFHVRPRTVVRWADTGQLKMAFRTPGAHRRFRWSDIAPLLSFPPDAPDTCQISMDGG